MIESLRAQGNTYAFYVLLTAKWVFPKPRIAGIPVPSPADHQDNKRGPCVIVLRVASNLGDFTPFIACYLIN